MKKRNSFQIPGALTVTLTLLSFLAFILATSCGDDAFGFQPTVSMNLDRYEINEMGNDPEEFNIIVLKSSRIKEKYEVSWQNENPAVASIQAVLKKNETSAVIDNERNTAYIESSSTITIIVTPNRNGKTKITVKFINPNLETENMLLETKECEIDISNYTNPTVDVSVGFSDLKANGNSTTTTTNLTLTFDKEIPGLAAKDITFSNVTGVKGGTITGPTGTGPYNYTLPISGFTVGGTLNVTVKKDGYKFTPNAMKTVTIYFVAGNKTVTFSDVTANGSASATTTELILTFGEAITGLAATDITLSGVANVNKATLGQAEGTGPVTYKLPITLGGNVGGELTVTVTKQGYTFDGSPKKVTIYYYTVPTDGKATINITWTDDTGEPKFTGNTTTGKVGTEVSVTATAPTGGTIKEWYLNGEKATDPSPIGTFKFTPQNTGTYNVTVLATTGSGNTAKVYSAEVAITVTSN